MSILKTYRSVRNFFLSKLVVRDLLTKGLFDQRYYREQLSRKGLDPGGSLLNHYFRVGESAGIKPHPLFDPDWYLKQNPDAVARGQSALIHYLRYGSGERRKPHVLFDPAIFEKSLPDGSRPERDQLDPIARFIQFAAEEKTNPNSLFDTEFYCSTYPEIADCDENPFLHYLKQGTLKGCSPSSAFDEQWYRKTYGKNIANGVSALEYHIIEGIRNDFATNQNALDYRADDYRLCKDRKSILVVAHSASTRIFGAERSLIDVLSVIDRSIYRIVLVLPDPSETYIVATRDFVDKVVVCRPRWWRHDRELDTGEVEYFKRIIQSEGAELVYVNTIMLREPLLAARHLSVPTACHVRELIDQDDELRAEIGLPAESIVQQVKERSDYIIANSKIVSDTFFKPGRTFTISNAVDKSLFNLRSRSDRRGRISVGMLSSNLPKKGIYDFYKLAKHSLSLDLPIDFLAFGPENKDTRRISSEIDKARGKPNLEFLGYCANAGNALERIDVVVNLSQFAESFGRTAAEGMAACRPVIAYDRGALSEVVIDGETGFLVTPNDPEAVLKPLIQLLRDDTLLDRMGIAGRRHTEANFSHAILKKRIGEALELMLAGKPASIYKRASRVVSPGDELRKSNSVSNLPLVTAIVPNFNYEKYLPERLNTIIQQTHKPAEIIFLDDCSSDNSIATAEAILSDQFERSSGIPYRIIPNGVNRGVYSQWMRAVEEAETPWIWIAEADDVSDPRFLEHVASKVSSDLNLVYAQSRVLDESGVTVRPNFLHHTNDLDEDRWLQDFSENGSQEVLKSLAFRNTIPNTSAAILRREAIFGIEDTLANYNFVGDWLLYAHLLRSGGLAFVSEALNGFRRHNTSVTRSNNETRDYLVELARVREFITEHFPVLPRHVEKQNAFMNKDYKILGWERNTDHPAITGILSEVQAKTQARKRVAFITTNNGSYDGGSEMLWQEVALALRKENHDVIVLIKDWRPTPGIVVDLIRSGVRVLFKEEKGFDDLILSKPDLVVMSLGDQDEGTEYYRKLRSNNLDYVIVNQLTKEVRFWKRRANKQKDVKKGYLSAKKVFFASENNHKVMEERLQCEIPHAAVHFNPYHIDRSVVPKYPDVDDGFQIAIPSKLLFIHKGQDLLIEALKDPVWRQRDVNFNLYGNGPDRENIEKSILKFGLDNLHLRGRVSDISEIWRDNHALLMPSRMEGMPIMLVSALLSARMCIVTNIGGHAEIVRDDVSGFIVPDPTVLDLLQALERAYENRSRWEVMGANGRADILKTLPEDPVSNFVSKLKDIWG